MIHNCPIEGCEREVPDKYLMCGAHWKMVSHATKERVWAAWADMLKGTKGARERYLDARAEAITEVHCG
jgi:hypothetical protein